MERNARKTNLVLFGVKESKSVDASERKVDNTKVPVSYTHLTLPTMAVV